MSDYECLFCPFCKADLKGEPIPEDLKKMYGGSTHYSRLIGIEVQGEYDGISYYECPDCKARWDSQLKIERRYNGKEKGEKKG